MIHNLELNDEDLSAIYSLIKLHLDGEFIDKSFVMDRREHREKLYDLLNAIKASVPHEKLKVLFEDYVKLKYLRDTKARHHVKKNVSERIKEAMEKGLTAELAYYSMNRRELTKRRVDIYSRKRDYLVGYCHLRKELRSFRMDRIVSVFPTKDRFEPPKDIKSVQKEVLEE